jgi:hypothetical protein
MPGKMNDEARMSKPEGMNKSEAQSAREDPFVIRASSLIRHSPFVIRHCHHAIAQ